MIYFIYVRVAGHKITMTSIMAVVRELKELSRVAGAMGMPEELSHDIFSSRAEREEVIGRVSEFWLQKNPSWLQLRGILISCNEQSALDIINIMEAYTHEGRNEL